MNKLARMIGFGLGLLAVTVVPQAAHAGECGMGSDIDWYAGERLKVARADGLLDEGKEAEAAWIVQSTWHLLRQARPMTGGMTHIAEAVRVMALASVRTDGAIQSGFGWSSRTAEERASNVRWGVSRLRMLAVANPQALSAKADLGEALSRSPDTEIEARQMLEALDMTRALESPEALAALARLRIAGGDSEGAALALARCESVPGSQDRCVDKAAQPLAMASSSL